MTNLLKKDSCRIINQYWYVIMGEKGIRDGICHAIYRYAKANNKGMKNYDKDIESLHLM